jgi:hypothetical protein
MVYCYHEFAHHSRLSITETKSALQSRSAIPETKSAHQSERCRCYYDLALPSRRLRVAQKEFVFRADNVVLY